MILPHQQLVRHLAADIDIRSSHDPLQNSYLSNLSIMVYTIVVHLYAKDDQECIDKLSAKLIEASRVYSKDQETISWFVMQDIKDPRAFTIVERYEQESVRILLWQASSVITDLEQFRARNITSRTPTGRPLILTSFHCWRSPWTSGDWRSLIPARMLSSRSKSLAE